MDGETMQKSFDDILKDGGPTRDFEITPEEATKFKTALGEPEFQAMLRDYMEEMQDPKQRAEQELYISELESQNRVPEGKEVVHPLPGFVIKTRFTRGSKDAEPEKLFTNVVTSDKLAKPYSKISNSRPGGEAWSLPVAVGPLRKEKDKGGGSTTTFDVCYHPEALVRADRLSAFRDLVVLSSLERVEDAFLRGTKEKITVDKKYRILKGVKYKSGPCAVMMVAKADINRATDRQPIAPPTAAAAASAEAKTSQRDAGKEIKSKANRPQTSAVADDNGAAPRSAGAAAEPKKAGDGESPSPASAPAEEEQSTPTEQLAPGLRRGSGGTTYKLVESGAFEISDHTTDRVRQTPTPRTLVVTVTLPADAELTRKLDVVVAVRRLTIGALGDPEGSSPRYLDLPLPYDVEDESKCSAARDKSGLLKITMPVKQPAAPPLAVPPPPPAAAAAAGVCSDGGGGGAAAATDIDGDSEERKETLPDEELKHDITTNKAEQTSASPDTTQQRKPDHSRWVEEAPQSEVLQKPWEALPAPPEKQGDARSLLPTPPLPPQPPQPLPPGAAETPGVVSQQQHEEEEEEEKEGQQEQQQEQGQEQGQQEKEEKETEQQQEQQQQEGEEQQQQQQQQEEKKEEQQQQQQEGEEQQQQQQQEEKKEEQQQQQHEEAEQQQQQQQQQQEEAEKQQQRRRRQQEEEEEEKDLEAQLAEDKDKLFIQSERFIRKVDGYEFKTGAKGCGYYRDDSRKKVPPISWNENIKTVCGVVDVPNIVDASVYYGFAENTMVLSFDAETPGQPDGGGARVDRYRTELVLAGGVAANKCSHDTAEDNLVLKLVKAPEREWGSNPTPTKATEVASKIDDLLGIAAAAATGPRETGAAARGGVQEQGPPAPGYEGSPPAQADVLRNSLAYEIE